MTQLRVQGIETPDRAKKRKRGLGESPLEATSYRDCGCGSLVFVPLSSPLMSFWMERTNLNGGGTAQSPQQAR